MLLHRIDYYCEISMMLRIVQGAEIMSQTSRVEAEDEADSDDDKSLPEDSASDSDAVSCPVTLTLFTLFSFLGRIVALARCTCWLVEME